MRVDRWLWVAVVAVSAACSDGGDGSSQTTDWQAQARVICAQPAVAECQRTAAACEADITNERTTTYAGCTSEYEALLDCAAQNSSVCDNPGIDNDFHFNPACNDLAVTANQCAGIK
ncbi:MAG: hypothetical protein R3B13_06675 [Polyangiaceae bacterium]